MILPCRDVSSSTYFPWSCQKHFPYALMMSWLRGQEEEARGRVSVGDDGSEVEMCEVVWLGRAGALRMQNNDFL